MRPRFAPPPAKQAMNDNAIQQKLIICNTRSRPASCNTVPSHAPDMTFAT